MKVRQLGPANRREKEATDWVTLTILNEKIAKWALENIRKGDPIYAECRVAERSYQKDGQTVYRTDIIANVVDRLAPLQQAVNDGPASGRFKP